MYIILKNTYSFRNILQIFINFIQTVKNDVLTYISTILGKTMSVAALGFSSRFGPSEGGRTYDHSYVMSSARLVSASPHSGSPPHPLSHARQSNRVRLVTAFQMELLSSS
jgi:hypothetical protein